MTDSGIGSMRTVGEAGEHEVIALVRSLVPAPLPAWVAVGIGDDAAVIEPERNRLEVITTDVVIEGVHFDRAFCDPASIGHKALAVNLSDLAAMGAAPRTALLSLGLPASLPMADLEQMLRAFLALATIHKVTLVGGNVARSPGPLFLDVTLTGSVKRRRVLTRSGGRPGDELYVTGTLGAATTGLALLQARAAGAAVPPAAGGRPASDPSESDPSENDPSESDPSESNSATGADAPNGGMPADDPSATRWVLESIERFLRPEARVRFGVIAGRTRAASACIDLSDGLGDAVRQLAHASGTGAIVEADAIPVHPGAAKTLAWTAALQAALSGGEDYELLLAVPRRSRRRFLAVQRLTGLPVTRIGALTAAPDLILRGADGDQPLPAGFEHFGGPS